MTDTVEGGLQPPLSVGDRVMVRAGKHSGMVMVIVNIRIGSRARSVVKLINPTTTRTFDEFLNNLTPVPVYPFA